MNEAAELRARIIERVRAERSPTRIEIAARRRLTMLVVLVVPTIVFLAWGGVRAAPRGVDLMLWTGVGAAFVSAGATYVGLGSRRSMLGRPRAHLVALAVLTPLLLFAWKLCVSSLYSGALIEWPDRPGLRCLLLGAMLSLAPAVGLVWSRRAADPVHPRAHAAAIGTVAGAWAWVLVDLWCPVSAVPHLLLGHVLPLLLTVFASVSLGSRILTMRNSP